MRKLVLCACLAGAIAAADVICTAVYVYKNPDSLVGRCAAMGFLLGTEYNPFLYGYKVVSANVSNLLSSKGEPVAQKEVEDFERPEEPSAVEEEDAVAPEPLPGFHALIEIPTPPLPAPPADNVDDGGWLGGFVDGGTVEPPLADRPECSPIPMIDPAVSAATGGAAVVVNPASPHFMPYCTPDADECMPHNSLSGWFWNTFADCMAASKTLTDTHFLGFWFSYFSSPSTLENKGDAELSEPEEPIVPDNEMYHHSDCPYSGACPYTGKMPSYEAPVEPQKSDDTEKSEPMKSSKKKVKMPKVDDSENSETPLVHPEIDTMEFRKSDRTWDDYGSPFKL